MVQPMPSSYRRGVKAKTTKQVATADQASLHHLINELLEHSGLTQDQVGKGMGCNNGKRIAQVKYAHKIRNAKGRAKPSFEWFLKLIHVCGAQCWIEFPSEPFANER